MTTKSFFTSLPYISVVIPCYNCAKTIGSALNALKQQSYAGLYQIICVDDGSVDTTADVIRSFDNVTYIYQENAGPAQARNTGADKALGDILVFTDSDCVPEVNWLDRLVEGFISDEVGAVAGSYGIVNKEFRLARGVHAEIMFRHHRLMGQYVRAFGSYNVAILKKIFFSVGGFDGSYRHASGEDNDLSYKITQAGYKIFFNREAKVDHVHPISVRRYLGEQYRHGYWRAKLYMQHPDMRRGDDYTFWKDMVEIPFVGILFILFSLAIFNLNMASLYFLLFLGFVVFETFFGILFCRHVIDGVFFGGVMALRAVVRTMGFLLGGVKFFNLKSLTQK